MIRKAMKSDLDTIYKIYDYARNQMIKNGNPNQWTNGYPSQSLLEDDIKKECMYIFEENGEVHGAFVFIIGDEPTYKEIKNGKWHSNKTYGTIHRIASDGKIKQSLKKTVDFALNKIDYIRIDTHEDNKIMQHLVLKLSFKYCGIIYVDDDTPRFAYDLQK